MSQGFTEYCERVGCNHNPDDHPNNGKCIKCNCVGFFKSLKINNPLQEEYIQKVIDMKTRLHSTLSTADHLNKDFPIMAKTFFDVREKENDKFWKKLIEEDKTLGLEVKNSLEQYEKKGRMALNGLSKETLEIIGKLMHHGANYQSSRNFIHEMILSFVIVMFRTYVKEISKIMYERDSKSKNEWKKLDEDEKEHRARDLVEYDIRDLGKQLKKNFDLGLKSEPDFDEFAECFYRRDMYIHNEGFPNKKYRDRVPYSGPDVKLRLDSDYIDKIIGLLRKYSELIEEFCLEKYMYVVNTKKKGNIIHVDLTKGGGKIIPAKDGKKE